jgi:hypothetical protein
MCHERWMDWKRRREERFDDEIRYLLDDERARPERPQPVVERERAEEPSSLVASLAQVQPHQARASSKPARAPVTNGRISSTGTPPT